MKHFTFRRVCLCASLFLAAAFAPVVAPQTADAQDNWAADDNLIETRKIERYQQLVDQSPEKSYAFNQLMNTVGKGAAYQKLLTDYEKKVAAKPDNFNLNMVLGHMYQYGGRTADALAAYQKAVKIKKTPLVYMSIAAAEAENRNFEQAVTAYEAAAALNPSREQKQEIYRALAEIALYRRDISRAKTYFAELIKLEPDSLFVRRELSQIYAQNKLWDDARNVLEEGLKRASANDREQIELDIAMLYEQEGNDDEALKRYEAISKKLPANHWMQRQLSASIIDIARRKGNVNDLIKTLESRWKSPDYNQRLELADLYEETNQPEKAIAQIEKAVSSAPKQTEAHERRIRFYRSHGQIAKMIDAQKSLIKAVPDNPDYRFELYEVYNQQKKTDDAFGVLEDLLKAFPNDFDTQRKVAEFYQMNGRHQKSRAIYENWVKKHPSDLEALEALGDQYDADGEKKKAIATWQKIEQLPIDKATKLESLARIYDEHGYSDEAEALYLKSLNANAKDCQAHVQYADILTRNGKHAQAIEAWQKLAQVCPTSPMRTVAARQLASIYQSRGGATKAIKQFKTRCESKPDDLNGLLLFAKLAETLQLPNDAIPTVQNYLQNHPKDTEAIKALSTLQAASGSYEQASQSLEALAQVSEIEKYDALIAMSDLDLAAGNFEAAQNHLSQALQLNASDADTHERLGDVLFKRRLYEEASHNYETAFQIDSRNFGVAFKNATCLSILAKDKEADAIYVQIVSNASDEALMLKAAQRAIDDHTYRGTLDELANALLPLQRSRQHKALYLEILLQIADAQSQPYILDIRTRDAQHLFAARHQLNLLRDKYSSVIVESLMSDDAAISSRALTLSEWLATAAVVEVLGQKIEKAPTSETGRLMQLDAIRAIAHAQLPAAVPILKNCMSSHYPRALREHAIWALGLIQAPSATAELLNALDINFDSFRAVAVIGLGRQNAHIDRIRKVFASDPSPLVKNVAAWALACNNDKQSFDGIQKYLEKAEAPYQIWTYAQAGGDSSKILETLWCGSPESRAMAARLIQSKPQTSVIATLTQPEAQGAFIQGNTTHYQSNFNLDLLLNHFAQLTMSSDESHTASWLTQHAQTVAATAQKVASGAIKSDSDSDCRIQLLHDFVTPESLPQFDSRQPETRKVLTQAVNTIQNELKSWIASDNKKLAGLSLRALALTDSADMLAQSVKTAQNHADLSIRIQAVDAVALFHTAESQKALRDLAKNEHYLVRATAISHLDPQNAEDKSVLQNALNDKYAVVAETARKRLE